MHPTNFCQLVEFYHSDILSSNDQPPSHTLMNFKEYATGINSKWVVEICMPKGFSRSLPELRPVYWKPTLCQLRWLYQNLPKALVEYDG